MEIILITLIVEAASINLFCFRVLGSGFQDQRGNNFITSRYKNVNLNFITSQNKNVNLNVLVSISQYNGPFFFLFVCSCMHVVHQVSYVMFVCSTCTLMFRC